VWSWPETFSSSFLSSALNFGSTRGPLLDEAWSPEPDPKYLWDEWFRVDTAACCCDNISNRLKRLAIANVDIPFTFFSLREISDFAALVSSLCTHTPTAPLLNPTELVCSFWDALCFNILWAFSNNPVTSSLTCFPIVLACSFLSLLRSHSHLRSISNCFLRASSMRSFVRASLFSVTKGFSARLTSTHMFIMSTSFSSRSNVDNPLPMSVPSDIANIPSGSPPSLGSMPTDSPCNGTSGSVGLDSMLFITWSSSSTFCPKSTPPPKSLMEMAAPKFLNSWSISLERIFSFK